MHSWQASRRALWPGASFRGRARPALVRGLAFAPARPPGGAASPPRAAGALAPRTALARRALLGAGHPRGLSLVLSRRSWASFLSRPPSPRLVARGERFCKSCATTSSSAARSWSRVAAVSRRNRSRPRVVAFRAGARPLPASASARSCRYCPRPLRLTWGRLAPIPPLCNTKVLTRYSHDGIIGKGGGCAMVRVRNKMLQIRLTEDERDAVRSAAAKADACSVTEWVLACTALTLAQPDIIAAACDQIRHAAEE